MDALGKFGEHEGSSKELLEAIAESNSSFTSELIMNQFLN